MAMVAGARANRIVSICCHNVQGAKESTTTAAEAGKNRLKVWLLDTDK